MTEGCCNQQTMELNDSSCYDQLSEHGTAEGNDRLSDRLNDRLIG